MKRGLTPYLLGTLAGVLFGALLTAYLYLTGIADITSSGYGAWPMMVQALPRAAKDLVPWLLIWLFVTPAVQRVPFVQPWLALGVSAALAVFLVPRMLGLDALSSLQLNAIGLFALVLTLPVVRANDVAMVASFFVAMHVVTVSVMGMPFGGLGEGIFTARLSGDELITGGSLGPVFGFAGMLGQLWLAGTVLKHQHLLFAGARARLEPRAAALRQLGLGLALASAAVALMFVVTIATSQSKIVAFEPSMTSISESLTTALPAALACVLLSCLLVATPAYALVRRGWLAAIIATAVTVALHWQTPGSNAHTAAGVGALTLAMTFAFTGTGRLWMPVGLTFGWLLVEGPIFGFPTNGFPIGHPWVQQQVVRYTIMSGGIIGPAASLIATSAKLLLVAAVALYIRKPKG
ncbi:MAG: hypothetical protein EPO35_04140 [Acidobacteria bacterium]|nr:MAG: hypothetical protein EPO35_04140 [Acidobacteriota bacterium]